jgi:hypothetical protein
MIDGNGDGNADELWRTPSQTGMNIFQLTISTTEIAMASGAPAVVVSEIGASNA